MSCRIWKLGAPGCADKKIYERDINGIKRFGEGLWKVCGSLFFKIILHIVYIAGRMYRNSEGFRFNGFFVRVSNNYGYRVRCEMRTLFRLHQSLATLVNKRIFLLNCKNNEVLPKSLNYNFGYFGRKFHKTDFDRVRASFLKSLLILAISDVFRELQFVRRRISFLQANIKRVVGRFVFSNFMNEISNVYSSKFDQVKQNQKNKLDILIRQKYGSFLKELNRNVDKWIVNLTDIDIPDNVKYILSLGPKFNVNSETIAYDEMIACVESRINCIVGESEKNLVRNEICNILQNDRIHRSNHKPKDFKEKTIHKFLNETKIFLKNNPNVLTLRADKGNVTVLMFKTDYIMKVTTLFTDRTAEWWRPNGIGSEQVKSDDF